MVATFVLCIWRGTTEILLCLQFFCFRHLLRIMYIEEVGDRKGLQWNEKNMFNSELA